MPEYKSLDDYELVALLRDGDSIAYTEIYNRYKALLYIFAYKRLHNREESKDIIHELFLSLWAKHDKIHLTSTLSAYLFTAVRNRIIDLITHQKISSRYAESFQLYTESGHSNTDHLVRQKELQAMIEKEIESLPSKMRLVFELSRNTNYTRKQIAEELDLSEQTVKSHMHHALKILKVRLGSFFSFPFFL